MKDTGKSADDVVADLVRDEWPKLVATLMRDLGDLQAAEDAAQEAAEIALTRWLDDGIPDRPGAWITTVARRRALDRIRRERRGREKMETLARLERLDETGDTAMASPMLSDKQLRDSQLGLFFGCCHPALSVEAQMALTLRSVAGLTTAEIAQAFLVPEPTMAQRLVRAKRKIAAASIPFRIPDDVELLPRLAIVQRVLYLLFNEGYDASGGSDLLRVDLTDEALRLTRLLAALVVDDAETYGLLALMLNIDARRAARTDDDGSIVLLPDQDRSLWSQERIAEAAVALDHALRLEQPGPTQVEAAIHALHNDAASADDTDWSQIVLLYRELIRHRPTSVVSLNHAVAVAMADGPAAGLTLLDEQELAASLVGYHYYHAARADLLRRLGRNDDAAASYEQALELTSNEAEQRFLAGRLAELRP